MTIPIDAMDLDDFKRWERGLPPRPKPKVARIPPVPPIVADEIKPENIPNKEIRDLSARRRNEKGPGGEIFCGWNVWVGFVDSKEMTGWMNERTFEQFKKRIPAERSDLFRKIG